MDGVLSDTLNWNYPKTESLSQAGAYMIGDPSQRTGMSWCIASTYLLASPLGSPHLYHIEFQCSYVPISGDDLPRLIHHLGPRYSGNFQDPALVKCLTYEASTSLNMFLSTIASKQTASVTQSVLMKAIKDGLGIPEASIIFAFSPLNTHQSGLSTSVPINGFSRNFKIEGDVFIVKAACLDMALWKIGGAAVALRLVQVANVRLSYLQVKVLC